MYSTTDKKAPIAKSQPLIPFIPMVILNQFSADFFLMKV